MSAGSLYPRTPRPAKVAADQSSAEKGVFDKDADEPDDEHADPDEQELDAGDALVDAPLLLIFPGRLVPGVAVTIAGLVVLIDLVVADVGSAPPQSESKSTMAAKPKARLSLLR